jgi:hypothetical protein
VDDHGHITGTRELLTTTRGYLQVRQGDFLGMGDRDLWVPLSTVQSSQSASPITLAVTARAGEAHFAGRSSRIQQAPSFIEALIGHRCSSTSGDGRSARFDETGAPHGRSQNDQAHGRTCHVQRAAEPEHDAYADGIR